MTGQDSDEALTSSEIASEDLSSPSSSGSQNSEGSDGDSGGSQNSEDSDGDDGGSWYHDAAEDDEDYRDEPDEDDDDDVFHDAIPGELDFEVVFEGDEDLEDDESSHGNDLDEPEERPGQAEAALRVMSIVQAGARSGLLTRSQLLTLLRNRDLESALFNDDDDDDDDAEHIFSRWGRRRRRPAKDPNRFPKVPSVEGAKLMESGVFGATDYSKRPYKQLVRRMFEREIGDGDVATRRRNAAMITQSFIPKTRAEHIIHYDDPIYSGQFSDDGNFFFSCCQDFQVRMYDTSNPYDWKHYKTVAYPFGQWTLTDASLSPDNRWLAYTSIQSLVSIAPTDPNDTGDPYSLNLADGQRRGNMRARGAFGIWSIRFSGDGRELVAGTNADSIVIYDIESRTVLHHIEGHDNDVNAVCFADKGSPHIIYSGSDDATIKVWDRRSMGDGRPAGAFVGHIEGLTYIDSKGDGRYILSNGKDQSMKLWDLRMIMSTDSFNNLGRTARYSHNSGFDYRSEAYDEQDWDVHPHDNSLVTFRGHSVLRTLIRCHFSPPSATNSRYVYSGSSDGKVYIWNMDATLAGIIDVQSATEGSRKSDRRTRLYFDEPGGWHTCVRDASWHPTAPVLVASAWNGYSMARGTCSMHPFNSAIKGDEGEPEMGRSMDEHLQYNPGIYYTAGL